MHARTIGCLASLGLAAGCAGQTESPPPIPQGNLDIEVAPLTINGKTAEACFDIAVDDGAGHQGWTQSHVCSTDNGHGLNGAVTIVGICDARAPLNTVTITMTELKDGDGNDLSNWTTPPRWVDTNVVCEANRDTSVYADFTVLTQGTTGFLDVVINTNNVSCNAKIDCASDFLAQDGQQAHFHHGTPPPPPPPRGDCGRWDCTSTHDTIGGDTVTPPEDTVTPPEDTMVPPDDTMVPPEDTGPSEDTSVPDVMPDAGPPEDTFVLDTSRRDTEDDTGSSSDTESSSDSDGSGSDDTGPDTTNNGGHSGTIIVALACDAGGDFTRLFLDDLVLTCNDADGNPVTVNVDPSGGPGWFDGYPKDFVFGVSSNTGTSDNGHESFWTVAVGIQSGWTDCHLSTRMAAAGAGALDATSEFPIIVANDVSFGFDGNGTFACDANPLDGSDSGLHSTWGTGVDLDFQACFVDGADGNAANASVMECSAIGDGLTP